MERRELPVPPQFDKERVGTVWRVPYQSVARQAEMWRLEHRILPSADDRFRICLIAIDVQNTFCIPGFELYVGGQSGTGAVDDNRRLCEFLYRNLGVITEICPTMDTHRAMQVFHSIWLVNENGEHPSPFTLVSVEDVERGIWRFNPAVGKSLGVSHDYGQRHLLRYARKLRESSKYELTIWPYHAMLGGIGHALVASFEEAVFFHSIARCSQPDFFLKGDRPLTEHYSVIGPEVLEGPDGERIGEKSGAIVAKLKAFDAVIIAGQAKSHCVAWTIDDLLSEIRFDRDLARKVYLLEDCTSPVVIPGVVDYSERADAAFRRFAEAGVHVVKSTDPIRQWHGIRV